MAKLIWKNEKRKVSELKPFEGNPRQATKKQTEDLRQSLNKFNIADPLIINTDNTVIGGNFRLKLLKEKGIEEVDVRVPSRKLTQEEAAELNLRLNKNQGEWDLSLLANFDENLLRDVGFSSDELDEVFGLEIDDEFDVEKELNKVLAGKKRRVKKGDVWQLGEHRLVIGDATKKEDVEKLMNGEKADMVITDPPYGLGGYAGRSGKFLRVTGDEGNILSFYKAIPIVNEMYIFRDWKFFTQIQNIFGTPRSVIVWEKPIFGMGRGYRRQYELIFYWGNYKGKRDSDIWKFEREKNYQHPTQKPIALLQKAIKNSSKRNDIVLDLFGGSGSTLIACEQLKRRCRMMEIEPIYGEVILSRWERFSGEEPVKLTK